MTMQQNPWLDALEEQANWRTGYFGFQSQFGNSPNQKKYYQNQFQKIQDEFMGKQAQQVLGGGAPNLGFVDFLKNYNWNQNYQGLPPQERGQDNARFNPFTRWNI